MHPRHRLAGTPAALAVAVLAAAVLLSTGPTAHAVDAPPAQQIAEWIEAPHAEVLALAIDRQISAYDARFIACARRLGAPLVTEDSRLRAATPGLSVSIAEAVAEVATR